VKSPYVERSGRLATLGGFASLPVSVAAGRRQFEPFAAGVAWARVSESTSRARVASDGKASGFTGSRNSSP
jgi:hypothetical protein